MSGEYSIREVLALVARGIISHDEGRGLILHGLPGLIAPPEPFRVTYRVRKLRAQ